GGVGVVVVVAVRLGGHTRNNISRSVPSCLYFSDQVLSPACRSSSPTSGSLLLKPSPVMHCWPFRNVICHTHTHTNTLPHTHTHTHTHTHSHTHTHTHTHTHCLTHIHTHTHCSVVTHTYTHCSVVSHTHTHTHC